MRSSSWLEGSVARTALEVEGGALPLLAVEGKGTRAVVVVPSAFGVADDLVAQMVELAADARRVVSFDPFFRGDARVAAYDDMRRVMARLASLDRERLARDLHAVIERARVEAAGVVLVGVCFGGPFALRAAAEGAVDGLVTWHATRLEGELALAPRVRCRARLHFGAVDPFVPLAAVEAVRPAFAAHHDVRIEVHEGATHGFTHRDAVAYHPDAERAAMRAVRELLAAA